MGWWQDVKDNMRGLASLVPGGETPSEAQAAVNVRKGRHLKGFDASGKQKKLIRKMFRMSGLSNKQQMSIMNKARKGAHGDNQRVLQNAMKLVAQTQDGSGNN
jgi:hypothetical protein